METNTRKLAHIEEIVSITEISGANNIELVQVLGWQCVAKKGEFKIGDKCCFIEIDSILPIDKECFAFMANRHYRVKTARFLKVISQGLALPISILNEFGLPSSYDNGTDITDLLKITKYLSPSEREADYVGTPKKKHNWFIKYMTRFNWYRRLTKTRSKSFPDFISQTDEERLNNCVWVLNDKEDTYYISEKADGCSMTSWYRTDKILGIFKKHEFGICSRSVRKFEMDNSHWSRYARETNLKAKLATTGKDICIQGELCGPKIQGNRYGLDKLYLFVFNVFDIKENRYYNFFELQKFCLLNNFDIVPILSHGFKLLDTVQEMVELAKGNSILSYRTKDIFREGIVVRSTTDHKKSFKVLNVDYLLKYEKENEEIQKEYMEK